MGLYCFMCIVLATASFAAFAGGLVKFVVSKNDQNYKNRFLYVICGILVALICLRASVTLAKEKAYDHLSREKDAETITALGLEDQPEEGINGFWERLSDSILSSLQTFTLDADYQENISGVKAGTDILAHFINGSEPSWIVRGGAVLYVIVLDLLAPIAGGSILFAIFVELLPQFTLSKMQKSKRKLYIFSELNDRSVAAAESIMNGWKKASSGKDKPKLVFSDAYPDDEDEKRSELINKARALEAVCVKDDVRHIVMKKDRPDEIFLIDEDEFENVRVLADLAKVDVSLLDNKVFHVFYNDDSYVLTAKKITEILLEKYKEKYPRMPGEAENDWKSRILAVFPKIERERCFSKMICAHLTDVPLFSVMTDRLSGDHSDSEKKEINLTIVGNGKIGIETLLTSYWIGQNDAFDLAVNMVSPDTLEDAVAKIDRKNPEILRTSHRYDDLLVKYEKDGIPYYNPTYFTFRYCSSELNDSTAEDMVFTEYVKPGSNAVKSTLKLTDSDYFLIAAGSDEENVSIAETVKRWYCINNIGTKVPKICIISYVVYDDGLCATLNEKTTANADADGFVREGNCYIRMIAMGSLGSIYDYGYSVDPAAKKVKENKENGSDVRHQPFSDASFEAIAKPYESWSQNARICHSVYRKFAAFCFLKAQTPFSDWCKSGEYESAVDDDMKLVKRIKDELKCAPKPEDVLKCFKDLDYPDTEKANSIGLCNMLEWLEHRRWNAYLRSIGYRFFGIDRETCKHMEFRLHYCLVEEQRRGEEDAKIVGENGVAVFVRDRLDEVMFLNQEYKLKLYDRPDAKYDK